MIVVFRTNWKAIACEQEARNQQHYAGYENSTGTV